jgi:hypothetical protein
MRPFALEITAGDFAFAAGHRLNAIAPGPCMHGGLFMVRPPALRPQILTRDDGRLNTGTMPSAPSRHAWANTVGPSLATCSLSRMPVLVLRSSRASATLRSRKRRLRRSSPSSSTQSNAQRIASCAAALRGRSSNRAGRRAPTTASAVEREALGLNQPGGSRDRRQSRRPVIGVAAVEPHCGTVPAYDKPISIMFDFVNPVGADRRALEL